MVFEQFVLSCHLALLCLQTQKWTYRWMCTLSGAIYRHLKVGSRSKNLPQHCKLHTRSDFISFRRCLRWCLQSHKFCPSGNEDRGQLWLSSSSSYLSACCGVHQVGRCFCRSGPWVKRIHQLCKECQLVSRGSLIVLVCWTGWSVGYQTWFGWEFWCHGWALYLFGFRKVWAQREDWRNSWPWSRLGKFGRRSSWNST